MNSFIKFQRQAGRRTDLSKWLRRGTVRRIQVSVVITGSASRNEPWPGCRRYQFMFDDHVPEEVAVKVVAEEPARHAQIP